MRRNWSGGTWTAMSARLTNSCGCTCPPRCRHPSAAPNDAPNSATTSATAGSYTGNGASRASSPRLLLPARDRERFVREVAANLADGQRWWQRVEELLSVAAAVPGIAVPFALIHRR